MSRFHDGFFLVCLDGENKYLALYTPKGEIINCQTKMTLIDNAEDDFANVSIECLVNLVDEAQLKEIQMKNKQKEDFKLTPSSFNEKHWPLPKPIKKWWQIWK